MGVTLIASFRVVDEAAAQRVQERKWSPAAMRLD